jgi:hypothetical protein
MTDGTRNVSMMQGIGQERSNIGVSPPIPTEEGFLTTE